MAKLNGLHAPHAPDSDPCTDCRHNDYIAPVMSHRDSRARATEALRLRGKRKTWAEISAELGYRTRDGSRSAVTRLLRSVVLDPALERAASTESLLAQERSLQDRFDEAVQSGNDDAAVSLSKELRSLVAERARLHGIYAPQRSEVDINVTQTTTSIIREAREKLLAVVDAEVVEPRQIER